MNSERQDRNSLQIVVQQEVLDCISLYQTHFQTVRRCFFQFFLYEREAGSVCDKGLLIFGVYWHIYEREDNRIFVQRNHMGQSYINFGESRRKSAASLSQYFDVG